MSTEVTQLLAQMRNAPQNVKYTDAKKVAEYYFGSPRQNGTSHCVFKMPWPGNPRVNLQKGKGGKAKDYQVKQLIQAIENKKLIHPIQSEDESNENDDGS